MLIKYSGNVRLQIMNLNLTPRRVLEHLHGDQTAFFCTETTVDHIYSAPYIF